MNSKPKTKVFLTGASGLLGRAIKARFEQEGWVVYGVALTRLSETVHKLDLMSQADVEKAITESKPDVVIHAAAQRFPDKVDADPEAARQLNVQATSHVVQAAAKHNIPVIYISTDYVFDGNKNAPYKISDIPNPLNLYGETKLEGEKVTLRQEGNIVLRVPVLYGPVESLKESAVTCLLEPLLNNGTIVKVSNVERRCPSHVDDIALICFQLATARLKDQSVAGVFMWCGKEKMTKHQMVLGIAKIFEISCKHIQPDETSGSNTKRPLDTELSRSRLEELGFGQHTPFNTGIAAVLSPWVNSKHN
ncbi:methionine adenosyltransferase 2 subunit beta-like [Macrosteles quadrilineatus]|uniref:methionine adenosyltransferase 2 subunit beta-like n=1 Tax=Macrosteles quadrilineatus TaxID=74068 RepID=UPI0023E1FA09|nr:methionine adenosyltransferase 2 subunit beta-like [Macrosteles quadrilineatus]